MRSVNVVQTERTIGDQCIEVIHHQAAGQHGQFAKRTIIESGMKLLVKGRIPIRKGTQCCKPTLLIALELLERPAVMSAKPVEQAQHTNQRDRVHFAVSFPM